MNMSKELKKINNICLKEINIINFLNEFRDFIIDILIYMDTHNMILIKVYSGDAYFSKVQASFKLEIFKIISSITSNRFSGINSQFIEFINNIYSNDNESIEIATQETNF